MLQGRWRKFKIVWVVKDVKNKPLFVELRNGNLDLYFQPNHNCQRCCGTLPVNNTKNNELFLTRDKTELEDKKLGKTRIIRQNKLKSQDFQLQI